MSLCTRTYLDPAEGDLLKSLGFIHRDLLLFLFLLKLINTYNVLQPFLLGRVVKLLPMVRKNGCRRWWKVPFMPHVLSSRLAMLSSPHLCCTKQALEG